MVPPVDQRKVVGSTVHAKAINVIAEYECQRIYGSHKKVKMVEGVVVNIDQQITKQRRKQFYVISDYKNTDGSFKRARLHIKSVVSGPVLVPVPVNLPSTATLLAATTTPIIPTNTSNSVPANPSTPVDHVPVPKTTTTTVAPALLPITTTVPDNRITIVAPTSDPTITTTVPSYLPNPVVPESDTKITTCVYANNNTQNAPVPDQTPPPTTVAPVPDTTSPTTSTTTVVADCHGVKWYYSKDVIDLDEVPSLQWKFNNKFGDPVYPNSGVWMNRLDAWLIMYGKKTFAYFFENTNLELLRRGRSAFKDMSEVLRLQCVVRLATRFEFGKWDEVWSTVGRK